jgi:hypothetical protein
MRIPPFSIRFEFGKTFHFFAPPSKSYPKGCASPPFLYEKRKGLQLNAIAPSEKRKRHGKQFEAAHAFLLILLGQRKTKSNHPPLLAGQTSTCDLPPPKSEDDFKHVVFFTIILFSCQGLFFIWNFYYFF